MFFCCQVKVVVWRVGWNKINISASAVKSTFHSVLHLPFELQRKPKKDKQKYVYDHLNFLYFKKKLFLNLIIINNERVAIIVSFITNRNNVVGMKEK
jgi:hypothetical protein